MINPDYQPVNPIGRPASGREPITVRISLNQRRWLDGKAILQQSGRSEIVRRLIQAEMDREEADVR